MRRWIGIVCLLGAGSCKRDLPAEIAAEEPTPVAEKPGLPAWRPARSSTTSEALVEVVEGTAVVRLELAGFEQLSAEQRILAYWLSQAVIAGDEITYDQRGRHNLAIKELAEQILHHLPPSPEREPFEAYAKKLWIHKGAYDAWSYRRFAPSVPPAAVARLAEKAIAAGASFPRFGVKDAAQLEARWPVIAKALYDVTERPLSIDRSPPEGVDILTASGSTYYEGVRLKDLQGFRPRFPQNSRLVRRGGRLTELVYRTGGDGIAPGLYAEPLSRVREALRMAMAVAPQAQRDELAILDEYLKTGEPQHFSDQQRRWVHTEPAVDLVLGFIEVYGDPRGEKGEFEGMVLIRDDAGTAPLKALAESAGYFEQKMPWDERFRRSGAPAQNAARAQLVVAAGGAGPKTPPGLSLPNETAIRREVGAKIYLLSPVMDARSALGGATMIREFTYDPADLADAERCTASNWQAHWALHQVIGHGSGQVEVADWQASLQEFGAAVEEARAELVALYTIYDRRLIEIGLVPDERCAEIHANNYLQSFVLGLREVGASDELEDDHLRAQSLVVMYARERGAVEVIPSQGELYLVVSDPRRWVSTVETLLGELMRIKAEGDYAAAKQLVNKYGRKPVREWRDDAVRRTRALGLPERTVYLAPRLKPLLSPDGKLIDAALVDDLGLIETALSDAGLRPLP
jgi:dipeptidyl-peptidase-3